MKLTSSAKRVVAWTTAVVLFTLASAIPLGGCYGPFKLTKKVHDWNGTISNKYARSIVFLALAIIPVYELCLLGDAVIFNLLEFWTGSNPMASTDGEGESNRVVSIERDGKTYELRWVSAEAVELSVDGATVGHAHLGEAGDLTFTDLVNGQSRVVHAADLDQIEADAPQIAFAERR